jgi:hypothetical protein
VTVRGPGFPGSEHEVLDPLDDPDPGVVLAQIRDLLSDGWLAKTGPPSGNSTNPRFSSANHNGLPSASGRWIQNEAILPSRIVNPACSESANGAPSGVLKSNSCVPSLNAGT